MPLKPSSAAETRFAGGAFVRAIRQNRQLSLAAASVVDIAIFYVLWRVLRSHGVLPEYFFPGPNVVFVQMWDMLQTMTFWSAVGHTMESWAVGLVLTVCVGTLIGALLGSSDRAYRFCRVVIEIMRPIPPIVILPIALLTLGVALQFKVLLVLQGTFWIMILQTVYGVHGVDRVRLETGRSYGLSTMRRFVYIQLPSSLPYVVTGVRIVAVFALIISIVAELVGGAPGLGNQILKTLTSGDSRAMYALILFTGILGVLITIAFTALESLVLFWHPSHRTKAK